MQSIATLSVGKEDTVLGQGLVGLAEGSRAIGVLPSAAVMAALGSDVVPANPWYDVGWSRG